MEASQFLRLLCRRYDVPFKRAQTLVPLVRRARELGPEERRKLLRVVESNLERLAREQRERRRVNRALDDRCLRSVAEILHDWNMLPGDK